MQLCCKVQILAASAQKKWNGKSKSFSKVLIENAYYFSAPLFFEGIEDVITQSFDATLCHKPQVVKQYEKILKVYSSIYQLGLPADEEFPKSINSECEGNAKIPMWSTNSEKCFYEKCLIMHALYDVTHQVKHQNFHHREKRDEIKSTLMVRDCTVDFVNDIYLGQKKREL